jgi:transcriptional regulator with XRE-family HTH domain
VTQVSSIGDRVRRLREEQGLSQRDLASPEVSNAYVSRIEAQKRAPSEKALRALAEKLGTTAHYLESGREHGPCPHCGK